MEGGSMSKEDLSVLLPCGQLNIRVAALIVHNNKVLLERGENSPFYVLPGGRIKFGESAEEAIVREMDEELNLKIKVGRCLYVHQNFFLWRPEDNIDCHELGFYFLAEAPCAQIEQNFRNLDGKSTFTWVDFETLKKIKFYPLCVQQNIDNLPEYAQLITERCEV